MTPPARRCPELRDGQGAPRKRGAGAPTPTPPNTGTHRRKEEPVNTEQSTETPDHIAKANGLRALADMIEQHPEIAPYASLNRLYAFHAESADDHAAIARAALASGVQVNKDVSRDLYNLVLTFTPAVSALVLANRADVCERVQVGTETVTERDPAEEAAALEAVPMVEVERPVYEWQCSPLLAGGDDQ